MYFGVGNPGPAAGTKQEPWGTSRPGPNLYTGSIVKLDSRTGELEWYYQLTPHALCDWDLQGPPILVKARGRELVVAAGKSGIVIALDRDSGNLVWKRPVGIHNGHDNDGIRAMRGDYSNLKTPMTVYPGFLGGVPSPPSTDGSTVFVPVVNYASTLVTQEAGREKGPKTGELIALDVATGAVQWKHAFPTAPIGAISTVNDLVFASTIDGAIYAFVAETGDIAWEVSLPTGITAGIGVSGDTLLVPAGLENEAGQGPQMAAYRLRD